MATSFRCLRSSGASELYKLPLLEPRRRAKKSEGCGQAEVAETVESVQRPARPADIVSRIEREVQHTADALPLIMSIGNLRSILAVQTVLKETFNNLATQLRVSLDAAMTRDRMSMQAILLRDVPDWEDRLGWCYRQYQLNMDVIDAWIRVQQVHCI